MFLPRRFRVQLRPHLTTRPVTWCPGVIGSKAGEVRPSISSSSVWQTPQAFIWIKTWSGSGDGTGMLSPCRGWEFSEMIDMR